MRNYDRRGIISAVMLGSLDRVESRAGLSRRVPGWAAALIDGLARDLPSVVTRADVSERLAEVGSERDVDSTVSELRRLGWFVGLPVQGVWAFLPPGYDDFIDEYLVLRAWLARDRPGFLLAGANAAWHLGYLDRQPDGRVQVWLPDGVRLPDGLRPHLSVVQISGVAVNGPNLAPMRSLLIRRKLDLVRWAGGLGAFGPEALVLQLATRPASFGPWADLVTHLERLVDDCDVDRLTLLLAGQSSSAWQRAAYMLDVAGQPERSAALFERRPSGAMAKVRLSDSSGRLSGGAVWVPRFQLHDQLIAPLLALLGKA